MELVESGYGVTVEWARRSDGRVRPALGQAQLTEEHAVALLAVYEMRVLIRRALKSPGYAWFARQESRVARLQTLRMGVDRSPEQTYRTMALLLDPECGADTAPAAWLPGIAELALLKLLARHGQPQPHAARAEPRPRKRTASEPIVARLRFYEDGDLVVGHGIVARDGHVNVRTYAMARAPHALLRRLVDTQHSIQRSEIPALAKTIDAVLRQPWALYRGSALARAVGRLTGGEHGGSSGKGENKDG